MRRRHHTKGPPLCGLRATFGAQRRASGRGVNAWQRGQSGALSFHPASRRCLIGCTHDHDAYGTFCRALSGLPARSWCEHQGVQRAIVCSTAQASTCWARTVKSLSGAGACTYHPSCMQMRCCLCIFVSSSVFLQAQVLPLHVVTPASAGCLGHSELMCSTAKV